MGRTEAVLITDLAVGDLLWVPGGSALVLEVDVIGGRVRVEQGSSGLWLERKGPWWRRFRVEISAEDV